MKKRHILLAGIVSIAPGFAFSSGIETMVPDPLAGYAITLSGHPGYTKQYPFDFASLEPVRMSGPMPVPSGADTTGRLRLAGWLFGPSIFAMVVVARRRDAEVKPG